MLSISSWRQDNPRAEKGLSGKTFLFRGAASFAKPSLVCPIARGDPMHLRSPSPQRPARRTTPSARPTLELLEDRCVPSAGFMQTNLASDIPNLAEHTNANLLNPW